MDESAPATIFAALLPYLTCGALVLGFYLCARGLWLEYRELRDARTRRLGQREGSRLAVTTITDGEHRLEEVHRTLAGGED